MKFVLGLVLLSPLLGCGSTITGGPGEISYEGVSYSIDQSANWAFRGENITPLTNMPTDATAWYNGIARGNINQYYTNGTASVAVDFGEGKALVSASVDFQSDVTNEMGDRVPDGSTDFGKYTLTEIEADISGNTFSRFGSSTEATGDSPAPLSPESLDIIGKFLGDDANYAVGHIYSHSDDTLRITFITKQ